MYDLLTFSHVNHTFPEKKTRQFFSLIQLVIFLFLVEATHPDLDYWHTKCHERQQHRFVLHSIK